MTAFTRTQPFSTSRRSPRADFTIAMDAVRSSTGAGALTASERGAGAGRKSRGRSRPRLESMEERTLMSNIPTFEAISVGNGSNPVVQVAPMEQTVVRGNLYPWVQTDAVRVNLQQGEAFTAGLDVLFPSVGNANVGSTLAVYGPDGGLVATQTTSVPEYWGDPSNTATDPITGAATYDNSVAFRAPSAGTYTIQARENPDYAYYVGVGNYTLTLRPIALNTSALHPDANAQDAQQLQFSGGALYAFLDANHDALTFSGPTGRGFSIAGNFSESTTPVAGSSFTTATISGTGTLTLESGLGNIPLPLPPGFALQVTTAPNGYNGLFGEVSTAQITFPDSSLIGDIVNPFGSFLGSAVQQANAALGLVGQTLSVPGIDLGIGLGDQVKALMPDAPVNPAVPYLYLDARAGVSYGIGQASVEVLGFSGSVVVDPADPSLYVHVHGVPGLSDLALGISNGGYFPFTPAVTPSHFSGKILYGDFYTNATVDLADLTEDLLPVYVNENVVVNLDTSGSGWTNLVREKATALSQGQFQELVFDPYDFALGINFTGGLSLSLEEAFSFNVALAGGTLIIDGPAHEFDVAATTALNPFQNTPASFLDSGTSVSLDGYVQTDTRDFSFNVDTGFSLFGYQLANAQLDFTNSGISYSANTSFLGVSANVFGTISYSGDAEIAGGAYVEVHDDLTWQGWGFTVDIWTNLHFDIRDGDLQVWGAGWVDVAFYGAGSQWWAYDGSFNTYDHVNVGSYSIWSLITDAENLW